MHEERIIVLFDSDVLKARRFVREMAHDIGFDETKAGEIEIALSELATNLVKHRTIKGEIVLKPLNDDSRRGIEIRAEDRGPGIKDIALAMEDGRSTAGTLGIGLSGVKRLMDEFSLDSEAGKGTTVIARKWLLQTSPIRMNFSVLARPKPGEDVSGDAYFIKHMPSYVLFCVVDILGHGREAHEESKRVLKVLENNYDEPLLDIIGLSHKELKNSRGAAMTLCKVHYKKHILEHIGIGNVETRVFGTPQPIRPFCFNGTIGMAMESYRVTEFPYTEGSTIVLFSDGISDRFDLSAQMLSKSPQEIASYIFSNFTRGYDDATVLVGR